MATEAIQITIPDFDEEEYSSKPIPFGRSGGHGFGPFGGGGESNSGHESPTMMMPIGSANDRSERSYFHSRGDSITSDESTYSTRYTGSSKNSMPFAHSSQSSIATPVTSPFTKKPSFASIRNAFKSSKTNDTPPVPQIEHQGSSLPKNPFNRSTSSLAQTPPMTTRKASTSTVASPTPRTHTPNYSRSTLTKKSHPSAKSQRSYSGPIAHTSENGSDHGHGFGYTSTPPPVPRVPNAFGSSMGTPPADYDDKVVMDPRTPFDYALHAVFIRFATAAESQIDTFLRYSLDQDPTLPDVMGPKVNPKFEEILQSLGKIGHKNPKPVIDSIMRWRRSQSEVGNDILRVHLSQSPMSGRGGRGNDAPNILNERKSLASIYIMCRALIAVLHPISKVTLGETMGYGLEETTFEQFRRPDLKLLAQSANHRINAELYATLLGHIANVRFMTVTDRFIAELAPVASGQVPKDSDSKYENLVKGLKHIQIKVWPNEAFVEGAEFLASLAKSFDNAHGLRLKSAFAEMLVHLLHPVGKTAQDEVNDPQWTKAIEVIYPKAKDMMSKPRYWHVAYPLVVTSLCVAPHAFFLRNWTTCFEAGVSKLKEKPYRVPVMNGVMRLIWTYLYRSREAVSAVTSKLDVLLRHFFPPNRLSVFPPEDNLEVFTYIVHFILSRHPEYGRDLCLDLLQEPAINAAQSTNVSNVLAPERMTIAIQAILLSLNVTEREESNPVWPSGLDFSIMPASEDYPSSSDFLPPTWLARPGMQEFFDRFGIALATIAVSCAKTVVHMSVIDEQWSFARFSPSYEEAQNFVIRRHAEGTFVYPNHLSSQISMLQTCFQSWPRCHHPSLPLDEAVDMLIRGVIHIEPSLGEVSCSALKRFMADPRHSLAVLSRFSAFLFNPTKITNEGSGIRTVLESSQLLNLWVDLVDGWIRTLTQQPHGSLTEDDVTLIVARGREIEAGTLFLLSHQSWSIHCAGVKVMRMLGLLVTRIYPELADPDRRFIIVDFMHGKSLENSYLHGYDELLDKTELERLQQWRESERVDVPLRLADSDNDRDRKLWQFVFPVFLQQCMGQTNQVVAAFREALVAAATRYHPLIAHVAGLSTRVPAGLPTRTPTLGERDGFKLLRENKHLVDQWAIWLKILCATATQSETSRPTLTHLGRDHSRALSDANFERERMTTTRGLFRYLTPFLDSEYTTFRDVAVVCISSMPSSAYAQLLEDLSLLAARQFYDESRSKPGSSASIGGTRRQERLHSAVARIYFLTAPFLQHQRSAGKQAALANVLKFVRNTQTFLTSTETRDNHTLQRLRRYFCGTVERLFDGLANLKDSDRFIPPKMHLALYRLCEEWCQYGVQSESVKQRSILMQTAAAGGSNDSQATESAERFRHETMLLSVAAVGALATLCQRAFFPPEISSASPTERSVVEHLRPLKAASVLDRFNAILSSSNTITHNRGKKGLRSLLTCQSKDAGLLEETLRRSFVTSSEPDTSSARFFEVVADIICNVEKHGFTFCQVVCLGLSNLCHPLFEIRRHAFNMLETIHEQSSGILSMAQFEATVGSLAASTYLHAHSLVSDFLAGEHPLQAFSVLAQFSIWLSRTSEAGLGRVTQLLLQSLEYWIPNIDLMTEDKSELSREGVRALYHLVALTLRHGHSHAEQVLILWTRLVEAPHQSNGHAAVRFLVEQSHKVGSTLFISCAANIVACLSQTAIGRQVFEDLCDLIEPARMLPMIEHKLAFPAADDVELWSDLDALFSEQPRLSLGASQFALLFLADVALERQWEMQPQLPVLLHALFAHLDHRTPFVRQQARRMLFQLMHSWAPAYDELADRSDYPTRLALKSSLSRFEQEARLNFWRDDETSLQSAPKMKWLSAQVLSFLEPLAPRLAERWGSLALMWGTSCSIRAIAFRSLQIFRALMPRVMKSDLALLLGRLSNTIAAADDNIQSFTSEIILTLNALATSGDLDLSILPQIFWCSCACLTTTVEHEFGEVLTLLESLLMRIDLDDPNTAEIILLHRPSDWMGSNSLQTSLLTGLRSSLTSERTFKLLGILTKFKDPKLIDISDGRVRDVYTASLPWCLQSMASETRDEALQEFALNIGRLADGEGRSSINKIMSSFVKGAFRTKDDFLRQSVASLREHYGVDYWTEVVTLLLGLVLNSERWLRIQAMQILKVLFQQRETRNPVELLGSELLMPLLRLLETDLAPQALEVLEQPMTISGGPAAKHVLRMSMHSTTLNRDVEAVADVFGVPEESGWCIARADSLRTICRANVMAVFDTCKMSSRPSRIEFEPEVEALADPLEEDLGGLVQNLHELTTFFQEDKLTSTPTPLPSQQLEARVAAILAKSTGSDAVTDIPQTPFFDVFRVDSMSFSDESDDDSGTDSEHDAFIYDSPGYRNGSRGH